MIDKIRIVSVEQMQAVERATDAAGVSYYQMMQEAGRGVAETIKQMLGETTSGKRVAILVGPGNNGGDGLVAARILKQETQAEIGCYLSRLRGDDDPVFVAARDAGVFIATAQDDQRWRVLKNLVANADIVVDALLGTGAQLPVRGDLKKILEHTAGSLRRSSKDTRPQRLIRPASPSPLDHHETKVVAVDCPSGLDCDTGDLDPDTIPADVTVTFAAAKYGQITFPGAAAVGELIVADIGTPENLQELKAITTWLVTGQDVQQLLPPRPRDGHKGTFGRAVIVGGSINYTGAAALAGGAAYRMGAGLVTMAIPQPIYPVLAAQLPEATWLLLPHDMGVINSAALKTFLGEVGEAEAWLIGPGLGREAETASFLRGLLHGDQQPKKGSLGFVRQSASQTTEQKLPSLPPLVIDADGLNLLAEIEEWWKLLPPGTVLTPHPGEMARLVKLDSAPRPAERIALAARKAAEWQCVVVLKGAFTVIAAPDGQVAVLPFASDALATAGTGDVLAGSIVGLLAQGVAPFAAAVSGAYVHALAGQVAAQLINTTRSVIAGDVLRALPKALAEVEASKT